jgi:uracil-DNA glycosylase family 4
MNDFQPHLSTLDAVRLSLPGGSTPCCSGTTTTFRLPTRCAKCPHGFARLVGSRGPEDSPLVIVGESPGKEEVKSGMPFVGPSGKVLEHALAQHPDIKPLMLNAFQCFPGSVQNKNQDKVIEATHVCQARLYAEIKAHPRQVILALGNNAIWSLTDQFRSKVTQVRGKRYETPLAARGIIASVHPAYLLRGGGSFRQFMADIDYACRLVKGADLKRYQIPQVHTAKTVSNVRWLADQIKSQPLVAADIETGGHDGFDHLRDRILCVGFCWDPAHVYVVPEELIPYTRMIFRAPSRTKFIWHFGKFDQKFFWAQGIPARVDEDTGLLSYALDETKGIHDLEQIAGDILGAPDWKFMIKPYTDAWKKAHPKQPLPGYDPIPRPILHDYMSRDISGTFQCFPFLRKLVAADPALERLYTQTLIPMVPYLTPIEMKGLATDPERIKANATSKEREADKLEAEFNQYAVASGFGQLNIRSPKQVGSFLYDTLKLRDPRRPNKRPDSTDEATLLTLQPHPAVKILLAYREVHKGLSTYVTSLPGHIGADDRVHTSYLIHGTTTGRLASRDPNILNIPRDPELRGQFVAAPNKIFMEVDVNQAELRVLAELSRCPVLCSIYLTPNQSIHKVTQIEMFGDPKTYSQETIAHYLDKFSTRDYDYMLKEQNMRAKCVNFGIVYGRTAASIAEEFKMPPSEAQEWINKWFGKYHGAKTFIMQCRSAPIKGQNLVTPFGRKRRFQVVAREKLNDIQNQAANFPEQSIASDIVTHTGMIVQQPAKQLYDADIVNTVYDSLLFELPNNIRAALELGARVLRVLARVPKEWGLTHIPFKGEIKIGTRWGSLEGTPIPSDIVERWSLQ